MTKFIEQLFEALSSGISQMAELLPSSPFTFERMAGLETIMGYVNYFIPFGSMLKVGASWLVCIGLWYLGSVLLRWLKAVE